ncbi:MAG: AAA family ATPase [Pyrinomonadaceae bacterium]|nr:AAA family ATPase [Pyrinomonadaceae bacterium]
MAIKQDKWLPSKIFAERFEAFRERFGLSYSDLNKICGNSRWTSRSSCYRLCANSMAPQSYREALSRISPTIETWVFQQDLSIEEKEEILVNLFPLWKENKDEMEKINRQELTSAAIKFFGLSKDPFDVDMIPMEFFTTDNLDEVAKRIKDAVRDRRWVVITGGVGVGKSAMKFRIERELLEEGNCRLIYPEFFEMSEVQVHSIARSLLEEFEVSVPHDKTSRVRKIRNLLTSLRIDEISVGLIFDECHHLNDKVLISLKNFWEMKDKEYNRLLSIVLFGQPKFIQSTLRDARFQEISERIIHIEMPSIRECAEEYLQHKLELAEGNMAELFEPKAIEKICSVAQTPLQLGNLANLALMTAFAEEETQVLESMLKIKDTQPQFRTIRKAA